MATLQLRDALGSIFYFDVAGTGTELDPYTPTSEITFQNQQVSEENPLPTSVEGLFLLNRILQMLKPLQNITGAGSNRLNIDVNTIGTISNITAGSVTAGVSSVTSTTMTNNTASIASLAAYELMKQTSRNAYANSIRSKISF